MVYHNNAVSAGFDMLTLPQSAAPAKASSKEDKSSFQSMLDKNVKNVKDAEREQPKAEQKDKVPEAKEEAPKQETEVTEVTEVQMQEAMTQAVVQLMVFPEQERGALNWGEMPQEVIAEGEATVQAVETAGSEQAVEVHGVQANPVKTQQAEGLQVKTEQPVQQTTAQTAEAKNTVQEQPTESKEPVAVKQEAADTKAVQKQDTAQKQDAVKGDTETDVAEGMSPAPKEVVSKEVELVQVKVGENKINMHSAQAADELAETVLVKVAENTNEYELQLAPEELGKIKIKLVIENGKISVAMSCENQKAADLLAATGGRLKAVIEERTGSETFVQVQQEENYQQQEKEGQHSGRGQEEQNRKQQEASPEELANFMQQLRLGLLNLT